MGTGDSKLPFDDQSVDLVSCCQAIHWFDIPKFYQEVNRVLKPEQGVLAIYGYHLTGPSPSVQAAKQLEELRDKVCFWGSSQDTQFWLLQVNLCQKLFFLQNMLCTKTVLNVGNNFCTQYVLPRFELGIFMYWTCNSMNNLPSYCGLVLILDGL